jgi:hypothetical protein
LSSTRRITPQRSAAPPTSGIGPSASEFRDSQTCLPCFVFRGRLSEPPI